MADSKRKTLYEDRLFRILWDEETKTLETTTTGQMSSKQFRDSLERLLTVMRDKKPRKYISDSSNAGNIAPEDMLWSEADWFPRAHGTGVRIIAIVMPKSLAGHLSVAKTVDKRDAQVQGIVRMVFADVQSAREWIVTQ